MGLIPLIQKVVRVEEEAIRSSNMKAILSHTFREDFRLAVAFQAAVVDHLHSRCISRLVTLLYTKHFIYFSLTFILSFAPLCIVHFSLSLKYLTALNLSAL